ncbi:protein DMP10 [Populus trichocarpa]|uniref:Uncharacterized protein n=1 Tax=Populus trichocarpa TaxID=3694 RepID=A0A3N7GR09_POPTR|nr:protein DMP10 [Populus trichocarpa]|eukprot:XP_024439153.1 protein DMP10 [Populus trichocarpa]
MSISSSKLGQRSQVTAANLANLLPTGTVLAAESLIPSFTNNGECTLANEYLTLGIIVCCSLGCFLSSFTDSFTGKDGKMYYGIATWNSFHIFNDIDSDDGAGREETTKEFLAASGANEKALIMNLPLGAGFLASFLFMLFPTKRRGIGYADTAPVKKEGIIKESA